MPTSGGSELMCERNRRSERVQREREKRNGRKDPSFKIARWRNRVHLACASSSSQMLGYRSNTDYSRNFPLVSMLSKNRIFASHHRFYAIRWPLAVIKHSKGLRTTTSSNYMNVNMLERICFAFVSCSNYRHMECRDACFFISSEIVSSLLSPHLLRFILTFHFVNLTHTALTYISNFFR